MKLLSFSVLLLLSLLQDHQSNSQLCNNRVTPLQFLASPSTFRGVTTLTRSVCSSVTSNGFICLYSVIIDDNEPVPLQPNLENSGGGNNDIGKFLVWPSSTDSPYMTFDLGNAQSVTAITIEFLNYPARGFSLPNLQLYDTSSFFTTDPNTDSNRETQLIEFELQNNNILSQDDYQVTNVSLIFPRSTSVTFLLRWDYTGVYNLDFFMVSEVDFCNDASPHDETQITFQDPQSNNSVIIPTVEELTGTRNTTINCTVSSSGLFEWQWKQNGSVISNNDRFNNFTADGTRTTILQITGLNVSDAAEYACEVRRRGGGEYMSRTQTLSFVVIVDLPGQVTGYLDERRVMLTCEVHGFLRSTNPPTWLGSDGSPIDSNTPKYTIDISDSLSRTAVLLSNGSSVPGRRFTLTINQLEMADEGTYTCIVDGNSAAAQLTVVAGSAPPPTPGGTGMTSSSGATVGTPGNAGLIAGVVIAVLLVIAVAIILIVVLVFVLRKRDIQCRFSLPRLKKISIPTPKVNFEPLRRLSIRRSVRRENLESSVSTAHQNGGSTTGEETPLKKKLTKADIEWQLPHIDNIAYDDMSTVAETALIYSEVNKPQQMKAPPIPQKNFDLQEELADNDKTAQHHYENEKAPPIPPQNFDPQEEMADNDQSKAAQHHYENKGFAAAQLQERRMTNASSPKLAKKKLTGSKSEGLDSNPIYEPTKEEMESKEGSIGTVEAPIYAQPSFPNQRSITPGSIGSSSEPIYSEAIHPELFSQGPEAPHESMLTPVAPVYAEPHNITLKKTQPPLKLPAYKIKELRPLGVGQFGEVMLAETVGLSLRDLKLDKNNNKRSIRIKVAVKKLRPQAGSQVRENFEKEIKFMSKLKDDNIVRLLAVSKDDPPFIVMEYMENGDLHQFLQDYEPSYSDDILQANQLPVSILLYMAVQIASGMRYLASLRYVHRDLATRNCLVGQNFVVKISDFGMSRSLYESSYYRVKGRAMLPIRWMASESFYGRFSEKTDVWSYGVTMWEIFTLAKHQPYEEIDDQEMIQDAIRGLGRRLLEKPKCCPMEVYEVMLRCWEYAPDDRANFEEIFNTLAAIHQSL